MMVWLLLVLSGCLALLCCELSGLWCLLCSLVCCLVCYLLCIVGWFLFVDIDLLGFWLVGLFWIVLLLVVFVLISVWYLLLCCSGLRLSCFIVCLCVIVCW